MREPRSPSAQLVSTPARDTPLEEELHWPEHASREQHVARAENSTLPRAVNSASQEQEQTTAHCPEQ